MFELHKETGEDKMTNRQVALLIAAMIHKQSMNCFDQEYIIDKAEKYLTWLNSDTKKDNLPVGHRF